QFITIAKADAASEGVNPQEAEAFLNQAFQIITALEAQGIDILSVYDFDDIFETDLEELRELFQYANSELALINNTKAVKEIFTAREQELLANDPALLDLYNQKQSLIAQNSIANTIAIAELENRIAALEGFQSIRVLKENQEILKNRIDQIAEARKAENNNALSGQAERQLDLLKAEINKYLITNVTAANIKNLPAVQASDSAVSEGLVDGVRALGTVIGGRVAAVGLGTNAGDLLESYGVWIKGNYTKGTQKSHGVNPGYKFDQTGVTIGADTGDESMLGIAYSYSMSDIKNKTNSSTKDDIQSHTGTIYGTFAVTNEAFITGQAHYGLSKIKKKRATGDINNTIATAKPKATTFGARAEVGYLYAIDPNIHIVPTIGVSHVDVKVDGYTEKNGLSRTIAKRKTTRTSGIASVSAKYLSDMGSMKLVPEVHANIDYAFNSKNSNTQVTLITGIDPIATPAQKLTKGYYNVGTSIKAIQADMYEISGGYDFGFAKKFQSHTGSLKLRINL
ncbi:MAG: autotransporter domain-containing protein, partial [Rickettsiaceae bacterium]|nr:autotransporter domain-containing protein [Rickettsiaceae bacterium]